MVSSKALQLRPEKRALYRELDALISRRGPIKDAKTLEAKAKRKAKIQEATWATMGKWKAQAKRDLKGMGRREILERISKKAGAAKARTGVKEKSVEGHGGCGCFADFLACCLPLLPPLQNTFYYFPSPVVFPVPPLVGHPLGSLEFCFFVH